MSIKLNLGNDAPRLGEQKAKPAAFPVLQLDAHFAGAGAKPLQPKLNYEGLNTMQALGAHLAEQKEGPLRKQWKKLQDTYGIGAAVPQRRFFNSDLVESFSSILKNILIFAIICFLPIYYAYVQYSENDPLELQPLLELAITEVQSLLGFEGGFDEQFNEFIVQKDAANIKAVDNSLEVKTQSAVNNPNLNNWDLAAARQQIAALKVANPYWYLGNERDASPIQMNRIWSQEEEIALGNALNHRFTYQRYKAVLEVLQHRLQGSESVFYAALDQKKFWIKMRAAMGLAEFGFPLSIAEIDDILSTEPADRIANFFRRFIGAGNPGERHVMRAALRLVGARARLYILQALSINPEIQDRIYLVAASLDPNPRIQTWLKKSQILESFPLEEKSRLLDEILRLSAEGSNLGDGTNDQKTEKIEQNSNIIKSIPEESLQEAE
ncbi:MAG: hypothetical protein KBD78_10060 [Oligoflexales bacterium]|nr:hypothetical protein [Oligoflexales bacterium]